MAQTARYGSWKSPITSDLIVAGTIQLGAPIPVGEDVYWTEGRPKEGGRYVLVRRTPDGQTSDVTPQGFNVRNRVHEYGGGACLVADGVVYFANDADQRVYRQPLGGKPEPMTPESGGALRYADFALDRARSRLICVREDHRAGGEAVNTIVALPLEGENEGTVLVSGTDFVSNPRLSPDGTRLSWLSWSHPNMPWDGTELWIGELDQSGEIWFRERVAGGPQESIFQPAWSPPVTVDRSWLHFVSDRSGWWNLYRWKAGMAEQLCPMDAEFGVPQWQFGARTYDFEAPERIVCVYHQNDGWHLARLDASSRELDTIDLPYTELDAPRAGGGGQIYVRAASGSESWSIVRIDPASGERDVLARSSSVEVDPGYLSTPRPIEFPTEKGLTAHAFYYPPSNKDFQAPSGEKPPLMVRSHGGPTSATTMAFDPQIQYWTSRGFGFVDVNYGGSTGYGRAYRQRLNGQWGVVDVDDCCNAARYLAKQGEVDENRMVVKGGSAGGYTTLAALTMRDCFKAGASYYGLSELEVFVHDTHKFESRYLESMIGPWPAARDLYRERSPMSHLDGLKVPVIFFQGLEDKIVPPNQAELMVDALRKKGVPVAYIAYEGEQHGFRRAENIKRSLDAELYFYGKVFGSTPADRIEPVEIENLEKELARR